MNHFSTITPIFLLTTFPFCATAQDHTWTLGFGAEYDGSEIEYAPIVIFNYGDLGVGLDATSYVLQDSERFSLEGRLGYGDDTTIGLQAAYDFDVGYASLTAEQGLTGNGLVVTPLIGAEFGSAALQFDLSVGVLIFDDDAGATTPFVELEALFPISRTTAFFASVPAEWIGGAARTRSIVNLGLATQF